MIDESTEREPAELSPVEDPIEFTHQNILATIDQRECIRTQKFCCGFKIYLTSGSRRCFVGEMRMPRRFLPL